MWQIILGISILCVIIEIFFPTLIFINFALAALICTILSLYCTNIVILSITFCVLSFLFIFTLRPLFIKISDNKKVQSGISSTYIGKQAKVIEKVDKNSGAISIYDERWQARSTDDAIFEIGEVVEIVSNDDLVFKVKKPV